MRQLHPDETVRVGGGTDLLEASGGFAAIGGGLVLLAFPVAGVAALGGALLLYALNK